MATSSRIGRSRSPFRSDETSAKITPKALFRLGSYKPFEFFLYIQGQLHAAETSLPVLAHIPEDCQSLRTEVGTSRSLVSGSVVQEPPGHPMLIAWRRYQRLSPELRVTLLGEPISILSDRTETVRTPIPVLQRTQTLEQCLAVAFSLLQISRDKWQFYNLTTKHCGTCCYRDAMVAPVSTDRSTSLSFRSFCKMSGILFFLHLPNG